jgi:hypothetical protein
MVSGITSIHTNVDARRRQGPMRMYYVFAGLMVVALFSFLQTVNVLNSSGANNDEHALTTSLKSFVQTGTQAHQTVQDRNTKVAEEKEEPIPNPIPADGNTTFSACLLVMDDNHRLVECEYEQLSE